MRLKSVLIVVGLLLGLASVAEAGYEDLFKLVRRAAWAVYVRTPGGMNAICSASAYKTDEAKTYLLSAGHCFLGNDLKRTDFLITQDHLNFVKARLYRSGLVPRDATKEMSSDLDDQRGNDWAIIQADIGEQYVLAIGTPGDLSIGEDLIVVGVPFGVDFLAVQGIVGSKDISLSKLVWNHYFGANVYVAGGNSGSGVVSPKQGALVGVVNAGPGSQSSMMIFMPVHLVTFDK